MNPRARSRIFVGILRQNGNDIVASVHRVQNFFRLGSRRYREEFRVGAVSKVQESVVRRFGAIVQRGPETPQARISSSRTILVSAAGFWFLSLDRSVGIVFLGAPGEGRIDNALEQMAELAQLALESVDDALGRFGSRQLPRQNISQSGLEECQIIVDCESTPGRLRRSRLTPLVVSHPADDAGPEALKNAPLEGCRQRHL